MADKTTYVLDANVFIEAARRYYAFDLAPVFWDKLVGCAKNGSVRSIDRVCGELLKGKDTLSEWAGTDFDSAFVSTDSEAVSQAYTKVIGAVMSSSQYTLAAKSQFADCADGWLVAHAIVTGDILVTHEVFDPNVKSRVPLPNVCQTFGIQWIDTFEMLRRLGIRFST